jgi:tetratricopeptide (TPR) repeat protein
MSIFIKIFSLLLISSLLLIPSVQAQDPDIGYTNSVTMAATMETYGPDIVDRLTEAELLQRKGEWQEALLTIDKALAQQSDWVPGLVARAEILTLMGRQSEAAATLRKARLVNERGTQVLMSYKLKDPVRYLALYPQAWMAEQGSLPTAEEVWQDPGSPEYDPLELDYFNLQYDQLLFAPDSVAVFDLIRLQLGGEVSELPADADPYLPAETDEALRSMLNGNIQLLYRQPNEAVYYYSQAIRQANEDWPELYYNRGLTFIYMNRYAAGCRDFETSAGQGFRPAAAMLKYLCNF